MNGRVSAYIVVRLAPGSYDVLFDGNLVAALTRDIDGSDAAWRIELLAEPPQLKYPPPFEGQVHTFDSHQVALDWLGGREEVAPRRSAPMHRSTRATPRYRTPLSPLERYRLRLLAGHSRFYATTTGLKGLIGRGFIATTGRTDDEWRAEWIITDAGRAALAELEP